MRELSRFEKLNLAQKIAVINQVLDQEVRPYVEMDAGGVEVVGLQGNQITITIKAIAPRVFHQQVQRFLTFSK